MVWLNLKAAMAVAAYASAAVAAKAPIAGNLVARSEIYGNCPGDQVHQVHELSKTLSSCAEIFFPGSSEFDKAILRWSAFKAPHANMVIAPCEEKDVVTAVKYANEQKVPFLAVNAGHGTITSLSKMTHGIQILINKLSSVKVAKDGKSATIGGGTRSKEVMLGLWKAGKQTVTGVCECVSYLGPALGGGHGWLQGHHGMALDQFLSLNVVLADGTLKTITPKDELFWGMRGAGHNFGIVTSVTSKVYDIEHPGWASVTLTFTRDKLEAFYKEANERFIHSYQPPGVVQWTYWLWNSTIDAKNPVIVVDILQEGVKSVDMTWTKPFLALGPATVDKYVGTYPDLGSWTDLSDSSPLCQLDGSNNPRWPLYLNEYNIPAMKESMKVFAENTGPKTPYHGSSAIFERYAMEGVQAKPLDSTAFPFREIEILSVIVMNYKPDGAERDRKAIEVGEKFRDILHKGSGEKARRVYVNYAYGDETPEELYGPEDWRHERLRSLKEKYDPQAKFDFYAPVLG